MIVVCDVNEIWRERPFAALADIDSVLGVIPADWNAARGNTAFRGKPAKGKLRELPVALPLGWASKTAALGQRMLWRSIQRAARKMNEKIEAVVVTSPHYSVLLRLVPKEIKTVYYASDDYRTYDGWRHVVSLERSVVQAVDHAFFVSQALADRACAEYGCADKISVSMNATDERFLPMKEGSLPLNAPTGAFKRPIAGVIGGINARLDFELLSRIADLPELGTLLLVGPLPDDVPEALRQLLEHPRCVSIGAQPHGMIHQWFQCLDLGLIPYLRNDMNKHCSPMRLFDHLASGAPIVATDACEQVAQFKDAVDVCSDADTFIGAVKKNLIDSGTAARAEMPYKILWNDRAQGLFKKIFPEREC